MATLITRTWKSTGPTGHKVKRIAHGYTLMVEGKQERVTKAHWAKDDARDALAKRILERDTPKTPPAAQTLAQVAEEYLAFKRGKGKRSIAQDEQLLKKLKAGLGAETPLVEITAQRIAQYDRDRVSETSRHGRPVSPSTVNRELAVLRHLLRLAEEWGHIVKVPRIRLAREPEGRVVWLEATEETALLKVCAASQNPHLAAIVTVALETGMRHGEIMALTWDRVDCARGGSCSSARSRASAGRAHAPGSGCGLRSDARAS